MKRAGLVGGLAVVATASLLWGLRIRHDTHPVFPVASFELKSGYSLELPVGWPLPDEEFGIVTIESPGDHRAGSLDEYRWRIGVHDYGLNGEVGKVVDEFRAGDKSGSPVRDVVLANGIVAKTWTYVQPMIELSQEHRVYVFKAPNGHVYSALEPMARDWRTKRRYDNIFRKVLGSMKFKS